MRARSGLRARTDFDVVARTGGLASHCRAIELSASGILVDRGRQLRAADDRLVVDLELNLPERLGALRTRGRVVWSRGRSRRFASSASATSIA